MRAECGSWVAGVEIAGPEDFPIISSTTVDASGALMNDGATTEEECLELCHETDGWCVLTIIIASVASVCIAIGCVVFDDDLMRVSNRVV